MTAFIKSVLLRGIIGGPILLLFALFGQGLEDLPEEGLTYGLEKQNLITLHDAILTAGLAILGIWAVIYPTVIYIFSLLPRPSSAGPPRQMPPKLRNFILGGSIVFALIILVWMNFILSTPDSATIAGLDKDQAGSIFEVVILSVVAIATIALVVGSFLGFGVGFRQSVSPGSPHSTSGATGRSPSRGKRALIWLAVCMGIFAGFVVLSIALIDTTKAYILRWSEIYILGILLLVLWLVVLPLVDRLIQQRNVRRAWLWRTVAAAVVTGFVIFPGGQMFATDSCVRTPEQ